MTKVTFLFRNGTERSVTFDGDANLEEMLLMSNWWHVSGPAERFAVRMQDVVHVVVKKT